MRSSHKISKLIFEISLEGDENQAKIMHSEVEQIVSKYIAEVLDKSLSKFDNERVDFIIDKLEIEVGSFDLKNDKEKFFREIAEKLEQEIHKIHNENPTQKASNRVNIKAKDASELIFYILRNGHLPWWADFGVKVSVNDFFNQFIQKPSSNLSMALKDELVNPVFRKRLINYLNEDELIGCVEVLIPLFVANKKLIVEKSKTSSLFKAQFFDLILQLPNQRSNEGKVEIVETAIALLQDHKATPKAINLDVLSLPNEIRAQLKLMQGSIVRTKKRKSIVDAKDKVQQETKKKQTENDDESDDEIKPSFAKATEDVPSFAEASESTETENSIEISNAGLVLILSFLSRFFDNIGIAKNREFISETEQHYAVYLLHYIATGSLDLPQEHELFFEKLICGVDVNDILKPCASLEKSHLLEVDELLIAVIENWKALKTSSTHTLQTAFLQRPGYLIQRDNGAWSLHIERQTIDILLDKIPWTISISRLPYSNLMIYTEW